MDSIKIKTHLGEYLAQSSKEGIETLIPYVEKHHKQILNKEIQVVNQKHFMNLQNQLEEYFAGKRQVFKIALSPKGTDFQKRVWANLTKVPYAQTVSYQDIASSLNNKEACRAVGSANGKNPIHIIIPCHRVIRKDGQLGGYAAGIDKKIKLLELERNCIQ